MKILGLEIKRAERMQKRRFTGAKIDRLTNDWPALTVKTNQDIKGSLKILKSRSRDLAKNNNHFKKFLSMGRKHVIGPAGIQLQMKVEDGPQKPDMFANSLIENEFYNWGKKKVCETTGKLSWLDCQELFISSLFCDGETVIRMIDNWPRNKYRFALQFIDSDLLDVDFSQRLNTGRVVMGVELDSWERPVNYHFLTLDNADDGYGTQISARRTAIAEVDIIHAFITEFVGQVRGIPRGSAAILAINMLNGYSEAELVAARSAACKGGYYLNKGGEYSGDDTENGQIVEEIAPGVNRLLPQGIEYKENNPTHPNGNYAGYTKAILREISGGLDVAYNSLANDLEGVNYSSMRSGSLEERDGWKMYQRQTIETLCEPVYARWLYSSLKSGALYPLPLSKYDKFHNDTWLPRRWTWVDPRADVAANLDLMEQNLTTPQSILAEYGKDLEDTYAEIQKARELAKKYGIEQVVSEELKGKIAVYANNEVDK